MSETQLCPCGSEKALSDCCLPYLEGKASPPTAEALLRSRYTAFTRGEVDYILDSHHSRTREQVKREEIEEWAKGSEWQGLKILQTDRGQAADEEGTVAFHARYTANGKDHDHFEHALFQKEAGRWKFVDAQALKPGPFRRAEPKVGRNDPCICGSGKKYKKCCADAQPVA
jgi:SEC-C motif-containing protein